MNSFLQSTHQFTKVENFKKFQFKLLNSMMSISIFFAFVHFLAISFGFLSESIYFQIALLIYSSGAVGLLFLLRQKKIYYKVVVYFFIVNSLFLFFFTLVSHPTDEFRLISFFLASFSAFILMGKRKGLSISFFIFIMVLICNQFFDLQLSSMAFSTFSTFFIIFTLFFYIFLQKIENDIIEFNRLYESLEESMNKEVRHRQEQEHMLLHQSRLASMGEMIEIIAHQWKQPLMSINSILMNINRSILIKKNPQIYIEDKIEEVVALTVYMSQTVDDFKMLLKDNQSKEVFDIQVLITQTLELLHIQLSSITLKHTNKEELMFYGNYSEFMQLLMILLNNAIDVLDNRNIIKKEIYLEVEQKEKYLILSVEDNASGIQESNLNEVFDASFTTKEEQEGIGLGLYIAQLIVQKNSLNNLQVQNTPRGAKFRLSMFNEYE